MAVLKRFSYDNIVEHNPTAPDPVEGGGGGESTPSVIFGGLYEGKFQGTIEQTITYLDLTVNPLSEVAEIPDGYIPIAATESIMCQRVEGHFGGYNCWFDTNNGTVKAVLYLTQHQDEIIIPENSPIMVSFVIYYVKTALL